MDGKCFSCGRTHHAEACPKKNERETCWYQCKNERCKQILYLTSRGQTPHEDTVAKSCAARGSAPPETALQHVSQASSSEQPESTAKRRRTVTCRRVKICGHAYTTLSWFLDVAEPSKSQRATAKKDCVQRAVQLQHGDSKTLLAQDYARHTGGRELLPGRTNLPSDWIASSCFAVRSTRSGTTDESQAIEIRKARPDGTSSCRGLLFRVDDLQAAFA